MHIILLIFVLLFSVPVLFAEDNNCRVAKSALHAASSIRELTAKTDVPCFIKSKIEVKEYLLHLVEKSLPPEKIKNEETIYRAIGLIPSDYDYKEGIVELYLNQLGGYYDPEKNYFVMADWVPAQTQSAIAVHELTHALQDQYYHLEKFIDIKSENGDQMLARSAVVEGDATAVMLDYERNLKGQGGIAQESSIEYFIAQNIIRPAMNAGNSKTPKSLQSMLIFPYSSGLRFVHDILRKGGYKKLKEVFLRPPNSTEEILHPEKYYNDKKDYIEFSESDLRSDIISEKFKLTYQDTIGEFLISVIVDTLLKEEINPAEVAAGWGGDKIGLFANSLSHKKLVIWNTNWDSEQDAEEFFKAYGQVLQKQHKELKLNAPNEKTDSGCYLYRENTLVRMFLYL